MKTFDGSRLPSQTATEAAAWIRDACRTAGHGEIQPRTGIILGSGLNDLLDHIQVKRRFAYSEIPHFAPTTVSGHVGQMEIGTAQGQEVVLLRGRYHLYEGHTPQDLALPVRTLHALGVETLIVTNAAGGLNPEFRQGDLMIMRDHIGLPTLAGYNPLIGPNDDDLGPRFPPMAQAYDPGLIDLTRDIARLAQVKLREGVYIMVAGPTYETPAEMRALRLLGADAVGMSTVPEVITARHAGMKVLGISCITNAATPETANAVNHEEVLHGAAATLPKLDTLLREFLKALPEHKRLDARHPADVMTFPLPKAATYLIDVPGGMPDVAEEAPALRLAPPTSDKTTLF